MSVIQANVNEAVKTAMKAKDKNRLLVLRMTTAAFKQIEVDERIELDDDRVLQTLDKLVKQRRESIRQYEEGGRQDLANQEKYEIEVLQEFLPQPLGDSELEALIEEAVATAGAETMKDMGKVMGILKPQLLGRADMGPVSAKIKQRLS